MPEDENFKVQKVEIQKLNPIFLGQFASSDSCCSHGVEDLSSLLWGCLLNVVILQGQDVTWRPVRKRTILFRRGSRWTRRILHVFISIIIGDGWHLGVSVSGEGLVGVVVFIDTNLWSVSQQVWVDKGIVDRCVHMRFIIVPWLEGGVAWIVDGYFIVKLLFLFSVI